MAGRGLSSEVDIWRDNAPTRIGVWRGSRVGGIYIATSDELNIGHCYVEVDEITTPGGAIVTGTRGTPIDWYLGRGTLAVATRLSGDGFNTYMPVTAQEKAPGFYGLQPIPELEFGAYHFGEKLGTVEPRSLELVAAGQAGLFVGSLAVSAEHFRGL